MKIALAGFHIESCTFSPLISRREDFTIRRGEDLLNEYPFLTNFPDCDFIPILRATAIPGGPVEKSFYASIKKEMLTEIAKEAPLDGIFLHLHGAAYVEDMEDAEGDLLEEIRKVVGENCLISASYDLHGNLSQKVVTNVDILSAYRTAPHLDWYETLERSCSILVNCLVTKTKPCICFIRVPLILPGEQTSTEWEPGSSLYSLIPKVIKDYNLLDASILIGYIWADEPRASASIITIGTDTVSATKSARNLANKLWDARNQFKFGVPTGSIDECIKVAQGSSTHPVVISDSGDNPTAGGVGDVSFVLERLIALNVSNAVYASIMDEEAIEVCDKAGEGKEITVSLGGKKDYINGKPLTVVGKVLCIKNIPSPQDYSANKIAVIQVQGIKVIITKYRTPFHYIADFEQVDIKPIKYDIIVVKIGYLVPELKKIAAQALLAFTPGAVNQNINELNFSRIKRPIFPLDHNMEWKPSSI